MEKSDFADLNRSIENISDPEDKAVSRAMAVLITATAVGPDTTRLAKETSYPKTFIEGIAMRMQEAGLWNNNMVDDREWHDSDGELIGERLFVHALVTLGRLKRHRTLHGYLYVDAATGETAGEWSDGEQLS